MDIFKQKRILLVVITILVLLNLTTIFLLWIGKPKRMMDRTEMPGHQKGRIEQLLKKELSFSDQQIEKYIVVRKTHQEKMIELNQAIRKIKKEMFDQILNDYYNKIIRDSLLNRSLEKQREIEELTFEHFLDLKEICSDDQEKELKKIMHKIFGPPHLRSNREGSHPPKGEQLPPSRN